MKKILIDFFEDNVRRIFWGLVVGLVSLVLWVWMEDRESAKTLISGIGIFALTQFRGNLPRPEQGGDEK